MKEIIFGAMAAAAFASCLNEKEIYNPKAEQTGSVVTVTFDKAGGQYGTRAFFDNTLEAEPYEKTIKSAVIYVFDEQGGIVLRKEFSAQDITGLSTTFVLPQGLTGRQCTFHTLANYSDYPENIENETDLLKISDVTSSYNGPFGDVSAGNITAGGFAMSGSQKAVIQPQGTPTNVSFVLKRAVAKIAVKVSVDENLASYYRKAKIFVKSITVSKAPSRMWIVSRPAEAVIPMDYLFTQESKPLGNDLDFGNLFYLPETLALPAAERVSLRIDVMYDQDGNLSTTDDQIAVDWTINIDGTGNGEIRRNGYYRISAVIYGFDSFIEIKSFVTAAEWESPVSQPVSNLN